MKIRSSVFRSKSEKELFTALQSTWSEHFNVWPSLPFLNVIDVEGDEVTPPEWKQLLKTEVDITLCTKTEDTPVVSIEFDGMGHGFSRGSEYVQLHPTSDQNRKRKLDLKLRIAQQVDYPLLVMSYHEKNPIGPQMALTIADGMIGQVLSDKHLRKNIQEWSARESFEGLDIRAVDERIQDQFITFEVGTELTWNPIARLAADYEYRVANRFGIRNIIREEFIWDPEIPPTQKDVGSTLARWYAMATATRVGCRVNVETTKGKFSEDVWLRNTLGWGVYPGKLARDIAKIIVLKQVAGAYGLTHVPPENS